MTITFHCEACHQNYRVPEEKAGKRARCKKCGNVLTVPVVPDVKRSPSGGIVLAHKPQQRDLELATGDEATIEAITNHVQRHIGEIDIVFHEVISDMVHVDIHRVTPTNDRPYFTLITSGMSDRPMNVPTGAEQFAYCELMIYLPPEWPMTGDAFEDERNYWPIRLLKELARLPHEYNTWLSFDHTVSNSDPPEAYSDDVPFNCSLLTFPEMEVREFLSVDVGQDKTVYFFVVVPLYPEEAEFKLKHGSDELFARLLRNGTPQVIDVRRRNVCRKRFGVF